MHICALEVVVCVLIMILLKPFAFQVKQFVDNIFIFSLAVCFIFFKQAEIVDDGLKGLNWLKNCWIDHILSLVIRATPTVAFMPGRTSSWQEQTVGSKVRTSLHPET
ncbi:hypothetical protein QVD17_15097 [Tagetes erecta]|uniref:Uncharacterized protein n=1 Tax=Tagetes erecta TaxID=13708 RepID=A0AAD8KSQ0_TARER|nr:hypothetical protein QVD17_15097 [Tagetes erecta]